MATLPANYTDAGFLTYLGALYPIPDTALTDGDETALRVRLLTTAYTQLSRRYDLGSAPLATRQDAVYAQAYFLYTGGEALQKRADLQAQGVIEAGIVKEKYITAGGIPVCQIASDALSDYELASGLGIVQRTRDMYDDEDSL